MTYTLINLVFLAAALAVGLLGWYRRGLSRIALLITAVIMIGLTIVFDNLMIRVGLFVYGEQQISGLTIGVMPIEDLSYTVFALLLLPALWELFGGRRAVASGSGTSSDAGTSSHTGSLREGDNRA